MNFVVSRNIYFESQTQNLENMESDNDYVDDWEFDNEADFLNAAQHQDIRLNREFLQLFMDMVRLTTDIVFEENLYVPNMEMMENTRGIFCWHMSRNDRQIWVFLIKHSVVYAGHQEPFDALLSLRLEIENSQTGANGQMIARKIAEDNLNSNEDAILASFLRQKGCQVQVIFSHFSNCGSVSPETEKISIESAKCSWMKSGYSIITKIIILNFQNLC